MSTHTDHCRNRTSTGGVKIKVSNSLNSFHILLLHAKHIFKGSLPLTCLEGGVRTDERSHKNDHLLSSHQGLQFDTKYDVNLLESLDKLIQSFSKVPQYLRCMGILPRFLPPFLQREVTLVIFCLLFWKTCRPSKLGSTFRGACSFLYADPH